jgi:hypothetical protein
LFDFLDSDWFTIGLEVVFLILISYDIKKYFETKKKEYITNALLTVAFAVWTLYPFYKSYFGWNEKQKTEMISTCAEDSNRTLCECVDEKIFKEYVYEEYMSVDKNATEYKEFLKEAKEDCSDSSWF